MIPGLSNNTQTTNNGYSEEVTTIIISTLAFILIVATWSLRNGKRSKIIDQSHLLLRPCPNPNCIRCELYKTAQESAKKRLPHIVKYLHRKYNVSCSNECNLERVIDGVKDPNNARLASAINGQYPSVLFVPRVPIHVNATNLHSSFINQLLFSRNGHSNLDNIRREYLNSQIKNSNSNNSDWQINNSGAIDPNNPNNQLWQVLYLMNQGNWLNNNIKRFPFTYELIKQMLQPHTMERCVFGNIFFSVLYPGTKIEEHCGPTNIRHRLHYTIISSRNNKEQPSSASSTVPILKVLNKSLSWVEGEIFVFDDSLVHSAEYPDDYSNSRKSSSSQCIDSSRVVLVIDLWHPDLSNAEKELITSLYPSRN